MRLLLLCLLVVSTICYNCQKEPANYPCPPNSSCSKSGICLCNQFYYGDNCDKILPNANSMQQISVGFSQGGFLGLIFGISFTFPAFLAIGWVIIYYSMKGRDL